MQKVVAIGGHAEHGKDTLADMIKEKLEEKDEEVARYAFAESLKMIAESIFDWDGSKDKYGRTLLQELGSFAREYIDEDFWVKDVAEQIDAFKNAVDYHLISDLRYPNEAEYFRENDYDNLIVKVTRLDEDGNLYSNSLSGEQKEHHSETSIDLIDYDLHVVADSLDTLEESAEKITEMITEGE